MNMEPEKSYQFGRFRLTPFFSGTITSRRGRHPSEPVINWLISDGKDTLLLDAGMSPRVNDGSFFPWYLRMFIRRKYKLSVDSTQQIKAFLRRHRLRASSINYLLLTHAHFDHVGNLTAFPYGKIILSEKEFTEANSCFALWKGYIPGSLPKGLHYITVPQYNSFDFNSGSNQIVPELFYLNSGQHTNGHLMFILKNNGRYIFFTGDEDLFQGMGSDKLKTSVYAFIKSNNCVFLKNHDWSAIEELERFLNKTTSDIPNSDKP